MRSRACARCASERLVSGDNVFVVIEHHVPQKKNQLHCTSQVYPLPEIIVKKLPHIIFIFTRAIAKIHPATIQSFFLPQIEAILQGKPTGKIFAASIQRRIAYRIGWMDHIQPPLLNMLIALLDYPYQQVKLEAIYALGKIHQPIPEPALHRIAQLRADSQSQAIRQTTDEVLAQSGKPQQNM